MPLGRTGSTHSTRTLVAATRVKVGAAKPSATTPKAKKTKSLNYSTHKLEGNLRTEDTSTVLCMEVVLISEGPLSEVLLISYLRVDSVSTSNGTPSSVPALLLISRLSV